tara:strand:+ start:1176 stop:1421 length:246 start_codon:yes stop_codon:yes gene_type:complete
LRLKARQFRRDECGLVVPNKRGATTSGALSGATQRAGAIFPSSGVISRLFESPNRVPSALPDGKMTASSGGDETATDPRLL